MGQYCGTLVASSVFLPRELGTVAGAIFLNPLVPEVDRYLSATHSSPTLHLEVLNAVLGKTLVPEFGAVAGHECESGGEGCLLQGQKWKLDSGQPASHVSASVDRGSTIELEALAALIRQLTHIAPRQNVKARFCIAAGWYLETLCRQQL
jgi:hypothetical protein